MATSSGRFLYRSSRTLGRAAEVEGRSRSSTSPWTDGGSAPVEESEAYNVLRRPPAWKVATSLSDSFHYAAMGVMYACCTQRNFRIHTGVAIVALGGGITLHLSGMELALIGLTCGLVMAMELVNTALEAVVDLSAGSDYHVLAKIAKDCGAGAVLIAALTAVGVAGLLLLPPFWSWLISTDLGGWLLG